MDLSKNKYSFSVVIPARNAESTLRQCLAAVFASSLLPEKVIVVNDGSADRTADIAAAFPCEIMAIASATGPMEPRYHGIRAVTSEICVFVDADIRVQPDTFALLLGDFADSRITAVTGILNPDTPADSFFSCYKNEYMNYIFRQRPAAADFLYGSIWAVRTAKMLFFKPLLEPFGSQVSDSEMGLRLTAAGENILLDHRVGVHHEKKYSFLKLLGNDFVIPFMFSLMFIRYGTKVSWKEKKGFSHAAVWQVWANLFSFLACGICAAALAGARWELLSAAVFCWGGTLWLWRNFIVLLFRRRGWWFAGRAALFCLLDCAVMFTGMTAGFIYAGCRALPGLLRFPWRVKEACHEVS